MARKGSRPEEAPEAERTYGSIRILRDGRVRFSASPGPVSTLGFRIQHHSEGPHADDPGYYVIDAQRDEELLLMLFVADERIESAYFNIMLEPASLRRAVVDLRKMGKGIERWLAPALECTQAGLSQLGRNPQALKVIPGLLRSLRDVPRAAPPSQWTAEDGAPRTTKPAKAMARKPGKTAQKRRGT